MRDIIVRLRATLERAWNRIMRRSVPDGVAPGAGEPALESEAVETSASGPAPSAEELSPQRRGLVPRWLIWTASVIGALTVVGLLVLALWPSGASIRVPKLVGLDRAAATERVGVLGLVLRVRDTRFSESVPAGNVILQSPKAGTLLPEGSIVSVDISAGSESFPMPDVIGAKLEAARQQLRDAGLNVTFVTVPSSSQQGTVVSTAPSAGTTVTVGEAVRLSVAAGVGTTSTVLPSNLAGLTFVIDPAFTPAPLNADINFSIARRIRALLESSSARVVLTRSITDTSNTATEADRLRRAKETTATALVQLYVATSGSVGLQVQSMPGTGTPATAYTASKNLATAMTTALRADYPATTTTTAVAATFLQEFGGPAVKVRLGSSASEADRLNFADGVWADSVARALYSAIARTYGRD